ncbi:MAG: HTH-type transcriptional regulator gltC [Bacillus sp. (in: firmicutes)]|nr:HTH-type transcriptional regulator gltC [Bacillus sp. (in: firmicutes)]
MHKVNLYQLYYFRTMAKMEHYTKAAEELCMTQPSLSHAISALESELDIHLFERQGRNVKLTKYGRKLLPYIENAIEELESGIKMMKEMTSETDNKVSLGFIYTLTSKFIPTIINGFLKEDQNRDIKFSLKEGSTRDACTLNLVRSLKEEKLDLVFISLLPNDPEIEFIPIFKQDLVVLLSNDCPLASHDTIDLKDTEPYSLIQYTGKVGLKQEINHLFEMVNMVPNVSYSVEDELSIVGLVAANIGIAIVPNNLTVQDDRITVRPISNPYYKREIYLGYIKNRYMSTSVKRFKDYAIKSASQF